MSLLLAVDSSGQVLKDLVIEWNGESIVSNNSTISWDSVIAVSNSLTVSNDILSLNHLIRHYLLMFNLMYQET